MSFGKANIKSLNGLTCLVQGLTGLYTTVDLRNDCYVSGKIDIVDRSMNITVSDAIFTDVCGNEFYYDMFFVKERNIRYVHIPEEVNIMQTIDQKVNRKSKRFMQSPATYSLKKKKLLIRQQETLARVREIKMERMRKKLEKESKV